MIGDIELDRVLRAFVAEGGDRAPQRDVEAALARIATTRQRRRRLWMRGAMPGAPSLRWIVVAGALLILAAGIALGVGAMAFRASVAPPDDSRPVPTPAAVERASVPLVPFSTEDWAVQLKIPAGWLDIGPAISEYRHFAGTDPVGHLSVTNESPFGTTICSPDCVPFEVPITIPYDPVAQLVGLKASVGEIAGSDDWRGLPADVLPDLMGGASLDTTAVASDGIEWRRVHVVGRKERNVVAIAWSQPSATYDEALWQAILDSIVLTPGPVYGDGDLVPYDGSGFTMSIPGMWLSEEQPLLDGELLSGVRVFAESRIVVSIGGRDGSFGWCDALCGRFTGIKTLDGLEAAIRDVTDLGPSTSMLLDGETARLMRANSAVERRVVIAMQADRPVAILLDAGDWNVRAGIFAEMIRSFAFKDAVVKPPDQVLTTADGRVKVGLLDEWRQSPDDDGIFSRGRDRMSVRAGGEGGSITTCGTPAGPWELCREITPSSLDELADAVQPGPLDDHGIGPPIGRRDTTVLGGEPAVITRILAYEYPAQGGQEVVYVVAMHHGRPFILRIRTLTNQVEGVEQIVAGFTFID